MGAVVGGGVGHRVRCNECEDVSVVMERSLVLSLPALPPSLQHTHSASSHEQSEGTTQTLARVLERYCEPENMCGVNKYSCPVCHTETEARRNSLLLAPLPPVVVLHLKGHTLAGVLRSAAMCCSVMQGDVVCCSVLQCVVLHLKAHTLAGVTRLIHPCGRTHSYVCAMTHSYVCHDAFICAT